MLCLCLRFYEAVNSKIPSEMEVAPCWGAERADGTEGADGTIPSRDCLGHQELENIAFDVLAGWDGMGPIIPL